MEPLPGDGAPPRTAPVRYGLRVPQFEQTRGGRSLI